MKKIVKKNTKKVVFTPAYIIDLTKAETAEETIVAIATAKIGAICTDTEIKAVLDTVIDVACDVAVECIFNDMQTRCVKVDMSNGTKVELSKEGMKVIEPKKPNVFKRFWNWITRKK